MTRMASHRSSKKANLVAQLPWHPVQINGTNKIENTEFYKNLCDNGSQRGKFKEKLYQFYNETTPFYLPQCYYTMDCIAIQRNSKDGQYWVNASHFLFCSEVHAKPFFFKNLLEDLNANKYPVDKLMTAFSSAVKCSLLKEIAPAECGSAEDFLLNPWVLVQLPFRPAVLHQWAVALLAEALRFQLEISDLLVIDTPSNYLPLVEKLLNMCNIMHESAQCALEYYSLCCLNHWAPKVETKFYHVFPALLPVLRFVLSARCKNVVRCIKRLSWNTKNTLRYCRFRPYKNVGRVRPSDPVNLYSQLFWRTKEPSMLALFSYSKMCVEGIFWQMLMSENSAKCERVSINHIWQIVLIKIIKTGRLGGVTKKMIYEAIEVKYAMLFKVYKLYMYYIETSSEAKISCKDEKYGLIFNIISLYSDVRVAEALDFMVIILYCTIADTKEEAANNLYINAMNAHGPTVSLSAMKSALYGVKSSSSDSYENLLARVKNSCFNPERVIFLDYELGPVNVAQHFQERIRIIAFRMIEEQYKSVKSPSPDEYVTNPELSTVLLLLPCFVASFLDLCSERGVNRAKKEKYMMFIHRVIYSYEKTPVAQKQFQKYENLTLSHHEKNSMKTLFREWAAKLNQCLRILLDKSRIRHEIAVKCMHYLVSCDAEQESKAGNSNSHWLQIDYVWYSHLLMFWDRIFESLLDIGLMTMKLDEIQYSNFKYLWSGYAQTLDSLRTHITDHIEFRTGAFIMRDKKKGLDLEELVLHKVPPALRAAAKKLSVQQLIGLIIYLFMKDFTNQNTKFDGRQIFPVNDYGKLILALIANDRWKVKMLMASERNKSEDFSLIAYQLAKTNLYYKEVMRSVTPSGKVTMKSPGEITFCPIKHCRWCGQADVKKFRVCPECKDNLDYPDLNFFCSETCEKQCLEKQHIEEHASYFMMLIGIK